MELMLRSLILFSAAGMLLLPAGTLQAQDYCQCQQCQCQDCQNCDDGGAGCPLMAGKNWPDAGWDPPARLPVNRDGIWYQNAWPQAWYGNSGGEFIGNAPSVYQPTDTTQLGYSYARVPTWRNVRMIPPMPYPSAYHARIPVPRPYHGRTIDGGMGTQSCPPGQVYPGQVMGGEEMYWSSPDMNMVRNTAKGSTNAPAMAARQRHNGNVQPASYSQQPPRRSRFSLTRLAELFN